MKQLDRSKTWSILRASFSAPRVKSRRSSSHRGKRPPPRAGMSGDLTVFCGAKRNPDVFCYAPAEQMTTSLQKVSTTQQKQGASFSLAQLLTMEVRRSPLPFARRERCSRSTSKNRLATHVTNGSWALIGNVSNQHLAKSVFHNGLVHFLLASRIFLNPLFDLAACFLLPSGRDYHPGCCQSAHDRRCEDASCGRK